jgi:hypothetical protein
MIKKRGNKRIIGKCCFECSKFIDPTKDHYVQLSTYNRSFSPDDHAFFHFQCWADYFNKRVENKMRANVRFMQEKAINLFNSPQIKSLLDQVAGSGFALNIADAFKIRSCFERADQEKTQWKNKKKWKKEKNPNAKSVNPLLVI